jgi:GNAT superfamily N-acetyltransferase
VPLRSYDPTDPRDLAHVGRVHAASRNAAYAGLVPAEALTRVTPQSQTAYWRDRMTRAPEPHRLMLWEHAGEVAGFVLGCADGTTATLHALHLLPHLHGSGAGQALHDAMLEVFAGWGCTVAELWVIDGNARAQAFYRRNGWAADGRRATNDVGGAQVPILRFVCDLPAGDPASTADESGLGLGSGR